MSDEPVSLTERNLDDHLRDLVKWKRFALYLPGIDQSDIEVIETHKRDDVAEQKMRLFSKWLSVHPKATWQDVTQALEKTDEFTIANKLKMKLLPPAISSVSPQQTSVGNTTKKVEVTKDVVEELDMLNESFIALREQSREAFKNGECSLSKVVSHVEDRRAYKICGLTDVRNVKEFFDVIEPHYTFLNCYLLVNLALSLLQSVKESAQKYEGKIEEFKNSVKVRSLHKTLDHFFEKATFGNNFKVIIKLQNVWGECNMWLVEVLVQTLFRLNSPDECKWFRVLPGSLCVVFMVHEDMLITLINAYKQNIQFMELIGVISLDTRNSFLPVSEDIVEYTFEQSLIEATKAGNTEAVEFLIETLDVDPNTRNDGFTPLFIASHNGHLEIVDRLLKEKVNPNTPCNDGATPLFIASHNGHLEIVERLLMEDANPNISLETGITPLYIASQNGHLEIVERLLMEDANPNISLETGITPLYIASQNGHLEIVERLLMEDANPNTPRENGCTPLCIASKNGHLEIVERLLKENINPNTYHIKLVPHLSTMQA